MSMLSMVIEEAKKVRASKVTKINLSVGELSGFVPDYIQTHFNIISRDTIAAGASLSFSKPHAKLRCRNCDYVYSPIGFDDGSNFACPNCKELKIEVISGREFCVESIEVE